MSANKLHTIGWSVVALVFMLDSQGGQAAPALPQVRGAQQAVERMLQNDAQGAGWRKYLQLEQLSAEIAKGSEADVDLLRGIVTRMRSGAPGLERGQLVALRQALESWTAQLTSESELARQARAAASQFRPLGQAERQSAQAELAAAVERLETLLQADPRGPAWRRYLRLDQLQTQLRGPNPPDVDVLRRLQARYEAQHAGLELVWFLDVRDALRQYLEVSRVLETPNMAELYRGFMTQLADQLERHEENPSEETALAIGSALRWLRDARQSPALVEAIRRAYGQPNLWITVSEEFVATGLRRPVNRVEPVTDCILGTSIFGTGLVDGCVDAQLLPAEGQALIQLTIGTNTRSRTVGYNGPVVLQNAGLTRILSTKLLVLDENGLRDLPTQSRASTNSRILDIQAQRGPRRLVEWIARRQSSKLKPQAEAIASRHAEARANVSADREAVPALLQANDAYSNRFRSPLRFRRLLPEWLHFRSSSEDLGITALRARADQLGASFPAPPTVAGASLAAQVHESVIHNVTGEMLAGRTVRVDDLQEMARQALGEVPPALIQAEGDEPWGITFARQRPVSVRFGEGQFAITIRADRFYRDQEAFQGMNVTATYQIAPAADGFRAQRQGDVEVYPPGFAPGSGRPIPPRLQAIRTVMRDRFSRVFPQTIEARGFTPRGQWASCGHLRPIQWVTRDRWMVLSWARAAQPAPTIVAGPVVAQLP